jgi:uncharacterized protein involved in exopolysaccharide biosynthesis
MNKRVVRRLLETFFRRWYLYLIPLVLFFGVGVWKATGTTSGYRSIGVVDVSNGTLLSQLTSIRGESFGYDTAATSTARTMNSLLGTGHFIDSIAEKAGVTDALETGALTQLGLRQSIYAAAQGDTLLQVIATTPNPELSARLVTATIDAFIDFIVAGDVSESRAAEEFFDEQLEAYREQLAAAEADLRAYVDAHPGGRLEERPLAERIEIERYEAEVNRAEERVAAGERKSEDARLATEQATGDVRQRLRIVDEPEIPLVPEPRLKKAVTTTMVFTFIGLLITVAAVVVATVTDRSLWSSDDIEHLFKLPVLAVVPQTATGRSARVAERAPFSSVTSPPVRDEPAPMLTGAGAEYSVAASRKAAARAPAKPARSRRPVTIPNEAST